MSIGSQLKPRQKYHKYILVLLILAFCFSIFFLQSVWEYEPDFHGFFDTHELNETGTHKLKSFPEIIADASGNISTLFNIVWFVLVWTAIPFFVGIAIMALVILTLDFLKERSE